jgi:hypothetical protein
MNTIEFEKIVSTETVNEQYELFVEFCCIYDANDVTELLNIFGWNICNVYGKSIVTDVYEKYYAKIKHAQQESKGGERLNKIYDNMIAKFYNVMELLVKCDSNISLFEIDNHIEKFRCNYDQIRTMSDDDIKTLFTTVHNDCSLKQYCIKFRDLVLNNGASYDATPFPLNTHVKLNELYKSYIKSQARPQKDILLYLHEHYNNAHRLININEIINKAKDNMKIPDALILKKHTLIEYNKKLDSEIDIEKVSKDEIFLEINIISAHLTNLISKLESADESSLILKDISKAKDKIALLTCKMDKCDKQINSNIKLKTENNIQLDKVIDEIKDRKKNIRRIQLLEQYAINIEGTSTKAQCIILQKENNVLKESNELLLNCNGKLTEKTTELEKKCEDYKKTFDLASNPIFKEQIQSLLNNFNK